MIDIELVTERLVLRPTRGRDAEELWDAIDESLDDLFPYMAWAPGARPEETRAFAEGAQERFALDFDWAFTIRFGDTVAGVCSVLVAKPLLRVGEIGYWMRTSLTGKGLMSEAVRAVSAWAFDEKDLARLELRAGVDNTGSVRVAEKVGYKREGVLRKGGLGGRGRHDLYMYGLLKEEFER